MCETLKQITARVNEVLGTNFNTILLNKYKHADDCIGFHKDRETGWAKGSGFATLAFGAARDVQIKCDESHETTIIPHRPGYAIYLPHPMNHNYTHIVPKRKRMPHFSSCFRALGKSPLFAPLDLAHRSVRRLPAH